jgi:hypothetical protein
MKSKCCHAEVKWIKLVPYCFRCHKPCEIIKTGKDAFTESLKSDDDKR